MTHTQAIILCKGTFLDLSWNTEVKILSADASAESSTYEEQQKKTAYQQQMKECENAVNSFDFGMLLEIRSC